MPASPFSNVLSSTSALFLMLEISRKTGSCFSSEVSVSILNLSSSVSRLGCPAGTGTGTGRVRNARRAERELWEPRALGQPHVRHQALEPDWLELRNQRLFRRRDCDSDSLSPAVVVVLPSVETVHRPQRNTVLVSGLATRIPAARTVGQLHVQRLRDDLASADELDLRTVDRQVAHSDQTPICMTHRVYAPRIYPFILSDIRVCKPVRVASPSWPSDQGLYPYDETRICSWEGMT